MGRRISMGGGYSLMVGRAFVVAGGVSSVGGGLEVTYSGRDIP
jgi:hypothetical protein